MTRDEMAVAFYTALLAKNSMFETAAGAEYQKTLVVRAFEIADIFECCKAKTLEEIKLVVHMMMPATESKREGPHSPIGPVTTGGGQGGAGSHSGNAGPAGMSGKFLHNEAKWNFPFQYRGEDDCSGGVVIPP